MHNKLSKLIRLYRTELGIPNDFYCYLKSRVKSSSFEFIEHTSFLHDISASNNYIKKARIIDCKRGDIRIDVPAWIGDIRSKTRIIVVGQEPRDTDARFNLMRIGNKVFASTFGVDRWNKDSTIRFKPQNKYYRVFRKLIKSNQMFILFTDSVKDFEIKSSPKLSQMYAKKNYVDKYNYNWMHLFLNEISIIQPTMIILLGNSVRKIVYDQLKSLAKCKFTCVTHPSNGGETQAKNKLTRLSF